MDIIKDIQQAAAAGVAALFGQTIAPHEIALTPTRKEFSGDYTIVVFPFTKFVKKSPDAIGQELGEYMKTHLPAVADFNVVKGFLNLVLSDTVWSGFLKENFERADYGRHLSNGEKVMVEYCSPNTNKPLHLGHVRNILLGESTARILEAAGNEVVRVQIINDRGIAICKSMLAWQKYAAGATPESTGIKSDHFVGDYYVEFEKRFREEYLQWQESETAATVYEAQKKEVQSQEQFFKEYKDKYFNEYSALGREASEMLRRWESGDPETVALWKKMNGWVYSGFEQTLAAIGASFDKYYYESDTYLLGKGMVEKGLAEGVFYKKEDGSVWVNLEDVGMDQKVLLRRDGTSVYITQDLGTARLRYDDFGISRMAYVVADEQNYHFQALFEVLKKLQEPYSNGLYHLAYGMVNLPSGRMKSREGTVVDADDLMEEVIAEARAGSQERGSLADLSPEEQESIVRRIGLAALKFHIIKVTPRKSMVFDPSESVDLQGQTGPYIQNAYVRIRSVLRKAEEDGIVGSASEEYLVLQEQEKELIRSLYEFPDLVARAAAEYDPSHIAGYAYNLAKSFHKFYHDHSILRAESEAAKAFRLQLSRMVAQVLKAAMDLIGIEMPEKM
jgi:arginyl-tRNA synthetase